MPNPHRQRAPRIGRWVGRRGLPGLLVLALAGALAGAGCGRSTPPKGQGGAGVSPKDVQDVQDILGQKNARGASPTRAPVVLPPGTRFSREDIPTEGGYRQIPLVEITDAQADRFLKRLKTEYCSCGCPHTIDQCLIDDPSCGTARTLALQVLREVTTGAP